MTQPNEKSNYLNSKYLDPQHSGSLSQCEILANVIIPTVRVGENLEVETEKLEYCIVMSQDCDLNNDFNKYKKNNGTVLRHIIVCELLHTEQEIKSIVEGAKNYMEFKERKLNEMFTRHLLPRHGFLERPSNDLPELIADFRMVYGIKPDFLYYQIENKTCSRITRLNHPYKEHFSQRFYFYQNRVALPEEHSSIV